MEQRFYIHTDGVVLLDGEFSGLPVPADSFVDSSIGSAADEAYDPVSIQDTDFSLVDAGGHFGRSEILARITTQP